MINSIYTHKEIYLRELISNASDAIDKLYYLALTDENIKFNREDFYIRIAADKYARKIIITDTGIGMSKEELENISSTAVRAALNEGASISHLVPEKVSEYIKNIREVTKHSDSLSSKKNQCWHRNFKKFGDFRERTYKPRKSPFLLFFYSYFHFCYN